MLFVAEYEFGWESLAAVVAKRVEWAEVQPEGFRFVGEYVWTDRAPAFRGVAVIDADDVGSLNAFVLHYGPTLTMAVHAATDVATGIALLDGDQAAARKVRPAKAKRRS
jgi:hypothetical protein